MKYTRDGGKGHIHFAGMAWGGAHCAWAHLHLPTSSRLTHLSSQQGPENTNTRTRNENSELNLQQGHTNAFSPPLQVGGSDLGWELVNKLE